jgi:hypothetical protein
MTQRFMEGSLTFEFPDHWRVSRPQETSFYRRHFQSFCNGCQEMDFQAYDPNQLVLWLIEIKDYRVFPRTNLKDLADQVAEKTRDILAMMITAGVRDNAVSVPGRLEARDFWNYARGATNIRVVLPCELPVSRSKLFPGVKDVANLQTKLSQKLRVVDPHPLFTNRLMAHALPWTVI